MTRLEFAKKLNNLQNGMSNRSNTKKIVQELKQLGFTTELSYIDGYSGKKDESGKIWANRREAINRVLKIKELDLDINTGHYDCINLSEEIKNAILKKGILNLAKEMI